MTWAKTGASPACPAVSMKASGRQWASEARWIFAVSPPRDRPMAWSAGSPAGPLFAGLSCMLVSAHDSGVERDGPAEVLLGVGLRDECGEHPLPAIANFIEGEVARQGYPPSMREIGRTVKLKSTSSVAHQLTALERKGVLYRDPNRPRAYRVRTRWTEEFLESPPAAPAFAQVPLLGRIAAGSPILAEEAVEGVFALPRQLVGEGMVFALKLEC